MKIKFLKAYNGDSVLIKFVDKENHIRNILIDGGTSRTYQFKNYKGKLTDGELKKEIDKIETDKEAIDLLILTHVDDDHIGGLLKWVENNKNFDKLVKSIWFNSGNLILDKFKLNEKIDNSLNINIFSNTDTTVKRGVTFEQYIVARNIWKKELICQQSEFDIYGMFFQILTPNVNNLKKLLYKWQKEAPENLTAQTNDYKKSLEELINTDEYLEDKSVHNGSSISFIMKYDGKSYLHLSDAHPSDIVNGLMLFGYNQKNKLRVDLVKVSHHGSKKNTSVDLLNCIDSQFYVISSDGSIHNLPDKRCLARIIKNKPDVSLGFNYSDLVSEIFAETDYEKYKFSTFSLETELTL